MEIRKVAHADFVKFDARSGAFVGVASSDTPDEDGEVLDLEASKPYFEAWSRGCEKRSKGKSFGNLREMHGLTAVGKLTAPPLFDMEKRRIVVQGVVIDPVAKRKAEEGVYTGLSIGGRYVKRSRHPTIPGTKLYVADPTEISIVDTPNNPDAEMQLVDADGAMKLLKFHRPIVLVPLQDDVLLKAARLVVQHGGETGLAKGATKRVGGKDLPASAFAYRGDPSDPATWKYPVHDAAHARNALARWGQEKGIPESEKTAVYARIKAAATRHGVDVSSDSEKVIKSLYDVGGLASCLTTLESYRRGLAAEADSEGDGSDVPDRLRSIMLALGEVLKDVTAEETDELLAMSATSTGGA